MKSIRTQKKAGIILQKLKELFPETYPFLNFGNIWELLVAVILSAQCTDERVNKVTEKLFKKYKNISDYANADFTEFEQDIYSTGFYRAKTKNIINSAKVIIEKFNGQVPDNMNDLLTLPGVARKTANVVLYQSFNKSEGIAVDTHVKRMANILGLSKSKDPNKIEKDLMRLFEKNEWGALSWRLIAYGRKYCPAKKHNHEKCPLTLALNG